MPVSFPSLPDIHFPGPSSALSCSCLVKINCCSKVDRDEAVVNNDTEGGENREDETCCCLPAIPCVIL